MSTIVERNREFDTKYRTKVIKKSNGQIVFSKLTTFSRRTSAVSWIKRIEKDFDAGNFVNNKVRTTVRELIDLVDARHRK